MPSYKIMVIGITSKCEVYVIQEQIFKFSFCPNLMFSSTLYIVLLRGIVDVGIFLGGKTSGDIFFMIHGLVQMCYK